MQQQTCCGLGVGDVSNSAKNSKEYLFLKWLKPFIQPGKSKSNFPDRTDDLQTNRQERDENGSNYNSHFGEN